MRCAVGVDVEGQPGGLVGRERHRLRRTVRVVDLPGGVRVGPGRRGGGLLHGGGQRARDEGQGGGGGARKQATRRLHEAHHEISSRRLNDGRTTRLGASSSMMQTRHGCHETPSSAKSSRARASDGCPLHGRIARGGRGAGVGRRVRHLRRRGLHGPHEREEVGPGRVRRLLGRLHRRRLAALRLRPQPSSSRPARASSTRPESACSSPTRAAPCSASATR